MLILNLFCKNSNPNSILDIRCYYESMTINDVIVVVVVTSGMRERYVREREREERISKYHEHCSERDRKKE